MASVFTRPRTKAKADPLRAPRRKTRRGRCARPWRLWALWRTNTRSGRSFGGRTGVTRSPKRQALLGDTEHSSHVLGGHSTTVAVTALQNPATRLPGMRNTWHPREATDALCRGPAPGDALVPSAVTSRRPRPARAAAALAPPARRSAGHAGLRPPSSSSLRPRSHHGAPSRKVPGQRRARRVPGPRFRGLLRMHARGGAWEANGRRSEDAPREPPRPGTGISIRLNFVSSLFTGWLQLR